MVKNGDCIPFLYKCQKSYPQRLNHIFVQNKVIHDFIHIIHMDKLLLSHDKISVNNENAFCKL
jgi:hypothetical protein